VPRATYVALDLETTGLDPDRDAIMEVGATRFGLDGPVERFHSLVDPRRSVPYRIQRLTGITQADLTGAPLFAELAGQLEAFIGDRPIVGQNVAFDLGFLERAQVRPAGPSYDTQELADLLLPDLIEHSLRGIARYLDIDFPVRHRALADAEAARLVFLALRARLAALPGTLLAEAARVAAATDWPLRHLITELLDEQPPIATAGATGLLHDAVRPPRRYGPPLQAGGGERHSISADEIGRALAECARDGIADFEERPEQVAMARAVTDAFNEDGQLLVEAGTGIGKSLAYLLPAAHHALRNGERVVVSTNTISLQEQLLAQDIPKVVSLLPNGAELRAAQLKGRRNYLCLLRWSNLRRNASLSAAEAKLLVRLLLWLPHTDTGDKAELRLAQHEEPIWSRLSAQNEACLSGPCAFVKDGSCFLLRARRRAESAHVLLVNHALLLSDLAVGGGVIPPYRRLIVDEAQHLEDEATDQFGFRSSENDLEDLLDRVAGRGTGLVASVRSAARGPAAAAPETRALLELTEQAEEGVRDARSLLPDFFLRLSGFVREQSDVAGDYDDRLRLTRAMRVQPDWADVELSWEHLNAALAGVQAPLEALHQALRSPELPALLDHDALVSDAAELVQLLAQTRLGIAGIVLREDVNTICWLTHQRNGGVGLASAPLRVADLLQDRLFSQKDSVALTSATLTVEGRFDYMRQALGLAEARLLQLGSPFDYAKSTVVLVPLDMPEPNDSAYMPALQQALIELVRASRGRALVLFTSHGSLRAAYSGVKRALEDEQILVLGQSIDGSPKQLIQALRDHPDTVILGAASFWEGIDVVGDALSLLVMARLPFSVPDDPVFQARSELFDDPFGQYAVPQAVLRFKQGFGRLIRRKTDRGAMVVLDGRIQSKTYGQVFLRSLPACSVRRLRLREMPDVVAGWLAEAP
jgi:DNA polymerase-3 subunit epsilon/ATP-dependent DNA helicase DinG